MNRDQSATRELHILMAEREIRRRLVDYCHGIDRCDAALTASAYHPDATDDHGSFVGSGHEFAEYAAGRLAERFDATQHTTGDPAIDFVSETAAQVVTYVRAEHLGRDADGAFLVTFEGEYRDRFEHRDGAWRIADRVVVHAWDSTRRIEEAFDVGRFTERPRSV
jgi:hypothetical protein